MNALIWYDRGSAEPTMVREMAEPGLQLADGTVRLDLHEWTHDPGSSNFSSREISILARLDDQGARWVAMTTNDHTTREGEAEFEASWAGGGGLSVADEGRYQEITPRRWRSTSAAGIGCGLVELQVGDRSFRCLRALDLPRTDRPEEIAQPLIDLSDGRTLAFWQYRPTEWDDDAAAWLAGHDGEEIVLDGRTYQRRNCTGRDEVMLSARALGIDVLG